MSNQNSTTNGMASYNQRHAQGDAKDNSGLTEQDIVERAARAAQVALQSVGYGQSSNQPQQDGGR
jgi:hypothetical protein